MSEERQSGLISLRARVLAAVGLTLSLSLASGAVLAGLRARDSLRAELQAALAGASQSAAEPFGDMVTAGHAARDLMRFTLSFDGSRHLRATAFDARGRIMVRSRPQTPASPAPLWFARWMRTDIASLDLAPAGAQSETVRVEVVDANDLADAWSELTRIMAAFAVFSLIGAAAIYALIGTALAPLSRLSDAFQRIGLGDYGVRASPRGVSELAHLTSGFNAMAVRLADIDRRNRSLEEQLLTLQDEERAEIARDLHDEIGPYLFAVNLDATLAERLSQEGRADEARERLVSIRSAVDHMQRQVREMLNQLRPTPAVDLGLHAALGDVVDFWREKRPEIDFQLDLDCDDEELEPRQAEALWRVTQEALSNAMRHARPKAVTVALSAPEPGLVRVRIDDDGGAGPADPRPGSGFGLRGMRERMAAAGGDLKIEAEPGRGWRVEATAPARRAARASAAAGGDMA